MAAEQPTQSTLRVRFISLIWGVVFLGSGLSKIVVLPTQVELFRSFGLQSSVVPLVGGLEFLFGALILSPRWRSVGALGVVVSMLAAALTHIRTGVLVPMVAVNAVLLVGAVYVFIKDRPHLPWSSRPRVT